MENIKITIDNNLIDKYAEQYFLDHPRAKNKPIKHPYHESINTWMIMRRQAMNALKQKWKKFMEWVVSDYGYSGMMIDKCKIIQTIYYPTARRHDVDNSVPKFILDGLVQGKMIVDDDSSHLEELTLRCDMDKENPRTELLIEITG